MGKFVKAINLSDCPLGQGKSCELQGKKIAVFNVSGTFHAIDDTCVHRGGPLGEGDLDGTVVTCPWHGWQYDVTTGVSPVNPAAKVQSFPCKVQGNDVCVEV